MGYNFPDAPIAGEVHGPFAFDGVKWMRTSAGNSFTQDEADSLYVKLLGDTMVGPLLLPADPTVPLHASTKSYVDTAIATNVPTPPDLSGYVAKTGDTMSGNLAVPSLTMGSTSLSETFNEWGSLAAATPVYFDFHSSGPTASDYDVRVVYNGGNATAGQGTVTFEAASGMTVTGPITANGFTSHGAATINGPLYGNGDIYADRLNYTGYFMCTKNGGIYYGYDGASLVINGAPLYVNNTIHAGTIWTSDSLIAASTVQATAWMLAGSGSSGTYYYGNTGIYITFNGAHFQSSHHVRVPAIESTNPDSYRIAYSAYGTFWRNDGATLYLMLTNAWDAWGSWNGHRPITVDLASGICNINGGQPVRDGRLAMAGDVTIYGAFQEPYGGAVVTGTNSIIYRFRYMQLCNTGWWTIGYA